MKYFSTFQTASEYNAQEASLISPHVSLIEGSYEVKYKPTHATENDYLTFVALESGTFKFSNAAKYSTNGGETWTSLAANTNTPTIASGTRVLWKANITPQPYVGVGTFDATCNFNAEGNVMSLMYEDDFVGKKSFKGTQDYGGFCNLFKSNTHIIHARNLFLPAITLTDYCYAWTFADCTSLLTAPQEIQGMATGCCYEMFAGCSSLLTPPKELENTKLLENCFYAMFRGCSSLTETPYVRCTAEVEIGACGDMFKGCTSLTKANMYFFFPETNACSGMFKNCSSLSEIKCNTYSSQSGWSNNWVDGVAASGTFTYNSDTQTSWSTGVNGIPSGWTVITT